MTRYEFMNTLKDNLKGMSEQEEQDLLQYYEEYFDEAGPENESEVIEELGNPVKLGVRLSGECAVRSLDVPDIYVSSNSSNKEKKKSKGKTLLIVAALIITSPLILPLTIVALTLIVTLIAVAFALAVAAIAIVVAGIIAILKGVIGGGLYFLGCGMVLAGVAVLCVIAKNYISEIIQKSALKLGKKKLLKEENTNEE